MFSRLKGAFRISAVLGSSGLIGSALLSNSFSSVTHARSIRKYDKESFNIDEDEIARFRKKMEDQLGQPIPEDYQPKQSLLEHARGVVADPNATEQQRQFAQQFLEIREGLGKQRSMLDDLRARFSDVSPEIMKAELEALKKKILLPNFDGIEEFQPHLDAYRNFVKQFDDRVLIASHLKALEKLPEEQEAVDYREVRNEIAELMTDYDYEDGSYGPVLVRLAWHSAGSWNVYDQTGGSNNATMRFQPESDYAGNAGLHIARNLLEPVKAKFPGLTYADLYTLAGVVAVEEMGGPKIPWIPGRVDSADNSPTAPDGRLPDAAQGADHVRQVFSRLGFCHDVDMVALSGAHCLGRCHTDRSGYEGPWSNAPTTFSNLYFTELLEKTWVERDWNGPMQYQDAETRSLMMLPTDMALRSDSKFRQHVQTFAQDEKAFFTAFSRAFSKLLSNSHPLMDEHYMGWNSDHCAAKIELGFLLGDQETKSAIIKGLKNVKFQR